jgi:glycosyltransferase involved in cell wall biosynthesis
MSRSGPSRLMVIIPDRITEILVKGEYQPNYYNPGEFFDQVHIVTTTDDRPDLGKLQRTVGRARLFVENVPENPEIIERNWRAWWRNPLNEWARAGVEIARRIRPHLVRCHGADWNGYLASRIKRALGIPYVMSLHINPDVNPVRRLNKTPLTSAEQRHNAFFEHVEHTGLRDADLVMPVYKSILPYLTRHGVERVDVCYNILNGPELRQKTRYEWQNRFRIICVGRLFSDKNPENLIRAVAGLPEAELTIVGDGPLRLSLESLVRDLQLTSRVLFRPAVDNDELCASLPEFDLFAVHTEFWELNKSVLEALLTGLPVVINRRNGAPVPELEGTDFARLVANTVDSYRDAIRALMDDDGARAALGRRAYAHARAHWAPEVTEAKVVAHYRRLVRAYA